MARFDIYCPRCKTELAFRAGEGEERYCAVCNLDFVIDGGEVLYDQDEAGVRPVEFCCPVCDEDRVVYARSGDEASCEECGLDFEIRRGRAYYDEAEVSPENEAEDDGRLAAPPPA